MTLSLHKSHKRRMSRALFKFSRCTGCCRGWLEKPRAGCSDCEKSVGYRECESELSLSPLLREAKKYVHQKYLIWTTCAYRDQSKSLMTMDTNLWLQTHVQYYHCKTLSLCLSLLIHEHDHAGLTCDADAFTAIVERLRGSKWASVVKINWFILNIRSSFSVNNRYKYLNVSAKTNESILTQNKSHH